MWLDQFASISSGRIVGAHFLYKRASGGGDWHLPFCFLDFVPIRTIIFETPRGVFKMTGFTFLEPGT